MYIRFEYVANKVSHKPGGREKLVTDPLRKSVIILGKIICKIFPVD